MSDEKLKSLTDLCHILFCSKPHATEMEQLVERQEGICYYNLEENLDVCWSCPDHERMLKHTLLTIEMFELITPDKAQEFFGSVLKLCQELNELISEHQQSADFVRNLIG